MVKQHVGITIGIFALLMSVWLIAGCNDPMDTKRHNQPGEGTVQLRINEAQAQTVFPNVIDAFTYDLTFTAGEQTISQTLNDKTGLITLEAGTWSLEVTANYAGESVGTAYVAGIEVQQAQTTPVNIMITPLTGAGTANGTLDWSVDFFNDLVNEATLLIGTLNTAPAHTINLKTHTNGTQSLTPGLWLVSAVLENKTGSITEYSKTVYIYPGLSSTAEWVIELIAEQPAGSDALAGKLLILQAYGSSSSAAGASHSFVELYNTTNEDINLAGITLYYADGIRGPGVTQDGHWKTITLTGTIPAKGSFLVLGPRQSVGARYQIPLNSGDINDPLFTLGNRSFKAALIRSNTPLTVQNPFDSNGTGAAITGYIDMVGAANDMSHASNPDNIFGFEFAPARNSASEAVRRKSLIDTNNNAIDFIAARYASDGMSNALLEFRKPRNSGCGAWNPFAEWGSPDDSTVAGPASPFAGSLLIFQAGAATDGAITRSFVELYNNTNNPINLDTYSLQYANTVGTNWSVINLTGTIPAKSSYLVRGPLGTITADSRLYIETADQTINDFTLSNRNFKVALMANQKQLTVTNPFDMPGGTAEGYVDLLGARNAGSDDIDAYETALAQIISKQAAARRSSLTDTDNNSADFIRIDYRASGTTNAEVTQFRPRTSANGAWFPFEEIVLTPEEAFVRNYMTFADEVFVMRINTAGGVEIAGNQNSDYVDATINIQNSQQHHVINNWAVTIRGRGNSTWGMPKKPYRIRGVSRNNLFGRERVRNWALIANYADKSFIRNYAALLLGRSLSPDYISNAIFTEVYFNGRYDGLYCLHDHQESGPSRVDVESFTRDEHGNVTDLGFLLELDWVNRNPGSVSGRDYFTITRWNSSHGANHVNHFFLKYPQLGDAGFETEALHDQAVNYIRNYVTNAYNAITSRNFTTFTNLCDIDSFIDFLLVKELTKDVDGPQLSVWMYKKPGEKLKMGPLWDFDLALGNTDYPDNHWVPQNWSVVTGSNVAWWPEEGGGNPLPWFNNLMAMNNFYEAFRTRYLELYNTNIQYTINSIDTIRELIRPAAFRNFERWQILNNHYFWPQPPPVLAIHTWDGQVDYVKNYLTQRNAWMYDQLLNRRSIPGVR
ncbi:MAG: CotH kinase family protein [Treponema sp.]|nr:CotH kinase family protein [Treponema sp.]